MVLLIILLTDPFFFLNAKCFLEQKKMVLMQS